jgi:hypothetical protein
MVRGIHHSTILNDKSLLGMTPSEVTAHIGTPTHVHGPYSWWWLGPNTADISSLMFHYDDSFQIIRVNITDVKKGYSRDDAPRPLDLEAWKDADPETRHKMNIDLVGRSNAGNLPSNLATIEDVDRYFPDATFVHNWNYTTGMLLSVAMSFDREGHVTEVWEGND